MDTLHLRTILMKIQDRLSDDDRRHLHFFLGKNVPRQIQDDISLRGTFRLIESLFDRNIINEQDVTFLINAFQAIGCIDAVEYLQEYSKQVQSNKLNQENHSLILPESPMTIQHNKICDLQTVLAVVDANCNTQNNLIVNDNSTKVNTVTVILDNQTEVPLQSKSNHPLRTQKCLLLMIFVSVILIGIAINNCIWFIHSKSRYNKLLSKQTETDAIISRLKDCLLENISNKTHINNTILKCTETKRSLFKQEQTFTVGSTCTCDPWCRGRGYLHGVCGNGHNCICQDVPITYDFIGDGCTCDGWCRRRDYKNGGICGDGYTCICFT